MDLTRFLPVVLGIALLGASPVAASDTVFYPAYVAPERKCFDDFQFKCRDEGQLVCATVTPDGPQAMSVVIGGDPHAPWCFTGDPRASNCTDATVSGEPVTVCLTKETPKGHVRVHCEDETCPFAYRLDILCPRTSEPVNKQVRGQRCP